MSYSHPFGGSIGRAQDLLHSYGLGLLFAANIFGAGSVYILTTTGTNFDFTLLWVLPLSLLVGLSVHEMSARLAVIDEPLMPYIRDVIGPFPAKVFAVGISFIMQFWSVANYALAGAVLAYLSPIDNILLWTVVSGAAGLILVQLRLYQRIEAIIAALVLAIFGSYLIIFFGIDVPVGPVAAGFIPMLRADIGYLTMVIALLGTTIYYPNFFIQSSMQHEKNWDTIDRYRRDHTVGMFAVILLSITVLIVAAITVPEGVPTVEDPARPLVDMLGIWALYAFLIGAGAASFSSATGTLFAAGFMLPQAFGYETRFGDMQFRRAVNSLIVLSTILAVVGLVTTGFTAVQLAILMPAVNGVIGLPLTVLALYGAMNRYFDLSRSEHAIFLITVVLMFVLAAVTVESLVDTIQQWS